ncbi:Protein TRIGALACTOSYLDIACYLGLYCEROL 2, chloroplastic [Glycine soja]
MITNPSLHASTLPSALSSSLVTLHGSFVNCMPCFPFRPQRKINRIRATSAADGGPVESSPASGSKNPLAVVLDIPGTLWKQTMRPLSDFGFGGRSIWEGGVGLFLVSGAVLFALSLAWLKGFQMRSKLRKYTATFEFDQACGICTGTPVRIRGVTVGDVIGVNPSLRSIEAIVEIEDDKTIIPRNSLVEVNQSGLLMETIIDITPRDPIPTPSAGPLDQECSREALIVCDREKIKGIEGVSLDKLVGIFTRLGQDVEKIGIANSYSLAERAASIIEEAKPLLIKQNRAYFDKLHQEVISYLLMSQMKAMAEDVQPLLTEVRDSGLLKEVETLTQSLTQATEDLRRVHSSIMTPENTELLQKSIYTLIFTLKNIENVSSDILGFTGDEATRKSLKLLIKSLSRLL